MNIIAIDVSKNTLDLLIGENPQKAKAWKIENSNEALEELLQKEIVSEDSEVVMESTGDYHRTASIFFLKKGFKVKILNPILTKQYTNTTIRKIKTDKTDAEKIMKLALEGEGGEITLEGLNNPSKELLRLSHFMTKLKTQLKLKLESVQTKGLIKEEPIDDMMEIIDRMEEIVKNLDGEAIEDMDDQSKLIDTIPGFSAKLSQIIVSECGDITRFKDANALVAYAGLDPKITQSGHSVHSTGRLTKRGSKFLRYALFLAARVAWRYDAQLYEYYEKKRGEGRSFTETICIISRFYSVIFLNCRNYL